MKGACISVKVQAFIFHLVEEKSVLGKSLMFLFVFHAGCDESEYVKALCNYLDLMFNMRGPWL